MNRKRFVSVLAAALLVGCASSPRSIEISKEQLQSALDRRFPTGSRQLDLLDVRVSTPRLLELQPQHNRMRMGFSLTAAARSGRAPLTGDMVLSFGLRYEPVYSALQLANVRVEQLDVDGMPEAARSLLRSLGPTMAQPLLEGATVYTFTPQELAKAQGWTPGEIRVTSNGLHMTLLPPAR